MSEPKAGTASSPADLQQQLRILQEENQRLTERSEDLLLLSLVAERIDSLAQADEIIAVLLERASLLKDIPFCAFGRSGDGGFQIEQQYASFEPGDAFSAIHIPAPVLALAMDSRRPLQGEEMSRIDWRAAGRQAFAPRTALFLPLAARSHPGAVLLFADDAADSRLADHALLLERLIDILARRLDNLGLIDELRQVNLELDALIQIRSVELQASQQRFRQLVENAPDAIVLLSADGRLVDANRQACRYSGLDREQLLASTVWTLVSAPDADTIAAVLATAAAGERLLQEWTLNAAGGPLPVEVSLNRLETGGQSPIIALIRDISFRRQLQGQLLQAQKMESVGRLAGGIAHDFNNLLSTIIGFTEMSMLDLPDESPVMANLRQVLEAGRRSAGLTRQLLSFSRKESLEMKAVRLGDVVANMARMLQRVIGEDVLLAIDTEADLPPVWADAGQLEQVLMNLVVNARDAMPEGGRLRIRTSRRRVDLAEAMRQDDIRVGDYACLSVRDTGCGMDDDTRSRIFEPFFTTKESHRGTGLGLSTAYGIVRQHRGALTVQSSPGQGALFEVLLPLEPSAAGAEEVDAAPADMPPGNETILVVDDDATIRGLVADILGRLGYAVLQAGSGDEALEIGRRTESIDLLLADVVMPNMQGRELAEEWQGKHPRSKIVLMSGFTEDHQILRRALTSGMRFLRKPIAPRELARIVREALDAETA